MLVLWIERPADEAPAYASGPGLEAHSGAVPLCGALPQLHGGRYHSSQGLHERCFPPLESTGRYEDVLRAQGGYQRGGNQDAERIRRRRFSTRYRVAKHGYPQADAQGHLGFSQHHVPEKLREIPGKPGLEPLNLFPRRAGVDLREIPAGSPPPDAPRAAFRGLPDQFRAFQPVF